MAWAAGLFDGEGTTYTEQGGGRGGKAPAALSMSVGQNDPIVLVRFHAAVSEGRVNGPDTQRMWRWKGSHRQSLRVLSRLWPYLSEPKKQQALKALRRVIDART